MNRLKKFLKTFSKVTFVILILSFVCMGVAVVVPHSHGTDLDHSEHSDCALHLLAFKFTTGALWGWVAAFIFISLGLVYAYSVLFLPFQGAHSHALRAPPLAI